MMYRAFSRLMAGLFTLLAITLLTFLLHHYQPGSPVDAWCQLEGDQACDAATRRRIAHRLGLDLPVFYVGVQPAAYPDTLYRLQPRAHRRAARQWLRHSGDWEATAAFLASWESCMAAALRSSDTSAGTAAFRRMAASWHYRTDTTAWSAGWQHWDTVAIADTALRQALAQSHAAYTTLLAQRPQWSDFRPNVRWHGTASQYHRWLIRAIQLDFGASYHTGQPVWLRIRPHLAWTLLLSACSLLLAFGIAIPLGVWSAYHAGSRWDRWVNDGLFALYALPNFWVATLALFFLASPDYLQWFPAGGVSDLYTQSRGTPLARWADYAWHLCLPVMCLTYPALAYLTRQMRASMCQELAQPYLLSARAKGLPERVILWRYALRGAFLPMATLLGNVLPGLVTGSVVLEVIFGIPGMGKLLFDAIQVQDVPVVMACVVLSAVLTQVGYGVSEVLYRWLDPRIQSTRL